MHFIEKTRTNRQRSQNEDVAPPNPPVCFFVYHCTYHRRCVETNCPTLSPRGRGGGDSAEMRSRQFIGTGEDLISYKLLNKGIDQLLEPIYLCYNIMLLYGIKPDAINSRIISIIPKSGKNNKCKTGWRPISISSNFGKPFDKIMAYRLLRYSINLKLIKSKMFGFIRGLGTIDAIAYLLDIVYNNKKLKNKPIRIVAKTILINLIKNI